MPRIRIGKMKSPALMAVALTLGLTNVASATFLTIQPTASILAPGSSETISVNLVNNPSDPTFQLQSVDLAIAYDPNNFTVSNVTTGTLTSGSTLTTNTTNPVGEIRTSDFFATGPNITPGQSGSVLTFLLTANPGATPGAYPINLQANFGSTVTAINEGNVPLLPAPTNGSTDVGVDATVVVGTAVPEPASILMLGMGGLFVAWAGFRLRRSRVSG